MKAADPLFSHQRHLNKAGMTCVECHIPAPRSTQAGDRLLPPADACASCHDGSKQRKVETDWLVQEQTGERNYRFNHQFHLQMGSVAPLLMAAIEDGSYLGKHQDSHHHMNAEDACEACHRGLRQADHATNENMPLMADCLVCHNKVDNPFSCSKCHLEGANLRPANHTANFVDLHSTRRLGLDKQTCLPCHGRSFTCMGCH
jgi:Cytochrome c7 and related cytochrome c